MAYCPHDGFTSPFLDFFTEADQKFLNSLQRSQRGKVSFISQSLTNQGKSQLLLLFFVK